MTDIEPLDRLPSVNENYFKPTQTTLRAKTRMQNPRLLVIAKNKSLQMMIMVRNLLSSIRPILVVGSLELGKIYEGSLVFNFFFALTGTSSRCSCIHFLICTFLASVQARTSTDSAEEGASSDEQETSKKRATG